MNAEDWLGVICKNTKDPLRKLAFADWLEEQDQLPLARAWRLIAEKGWRPFYERRAVIFLGRKTSHDWWRSRSRGGKPGNDLPHKVFRLLIPPPSARNQERACDWREYPSRKEAYSALANALVELEKEGLED